VIGDAHDHLHVAPREDFKYKTDARLGVAAASAPDAAFDAATSSSMLAAG